MHNNPWPEDTLFITDKCIGPNGDYLIPRSHYSLCWLGSIQHEIAHHSHYETASKPYNAFVAFHCFTLCARRLRSILSVHTILRAHGCRTLVTNCACSACFTARLRSHYARSQCWHGPAWHCKAGWASTVRPALDSVHTRGNPSQPALKRLVWTGIRRYCMTLE